MADLTGMMQAAAGGAGGGVNYIENVFSTYLYTGDDTTRTITNGIDLAGEGGLVWFKARSGANGPALIDTARGGTQVLATNADNGQSNFSPQGISAFNANGFTFGTTTTNLNANGTTYASWTFRKQPKFFDVVTWTGTGVNRTIAHSLGSVPGCIIVKRTDTTADWAVYHRSLANTQYMVLNSTAAVATGATWWNSTTPTSAVFSLGTDATVNASGGTYVAYVLAHDAGGFGLTGEDNVVSCGSYTGDGTNGQSVSLGYEPQWLLIKRTDTANSWFLQDTMRPFSVTATEWLQPNTASVESTGGVAYVSPTATGFTFTSGGSSAYNASGGTYIYIAIRRGPMKVPELGTTVFDPVARAGTGTTATVTGVGFPPDLVMIKNRSTDVGGVNSSCNVFSRLTNYDRGLYTALTNAESGANAVLASINMNGVSFPAANYSAINGSADTYINYFFGRAPGFFDQVCYTGNGGNMTISHNLSAVPTLMIVKGTNATSAGQWRVYDVFDGNDNYMALNTTAATASGYGAYWNTTTPTSSVFYVGSANTTNTGTYVAYLFATLAGVSKVGSYTGTAATQVINCGFTTGARFVLIKRTDSTGDWYVWDSARGIIAGNDPYFLFNTTAAEVTNTDYVDTAATGFELTSTAPAAINASGGSYIFLAIS
jgi:hypothetical protein